MTIRLVSVRPCSVVLVVWFWTLKPRAGVTKITVLHMQFMRHNLNIFICNFVSFNKRLSAPVKAYSVRGGLVMLQVLSDGIVSASNRIKPWQIHSICLMCTHINQASKMHRSCCASALAGGTTGPRHLVNGHCLQWKGCKATLSISSVMSRRLKKLFQ